MDRRSAQTEMGKHGEFPGLPFIVDVANACVIACAIVLMLVVFVFIFVGAGGLIGVEFLADESVERGRLRQENTVSSQDQLLLLTNLANACVVTLTLVIFVFIFVGAWVANNGRVVCQWISGAQQTNMGKHGEFLVPGLRFCC